MKVVVIDDSPEIIEVVTLCFQLRWGSATVSPAHDGNKGLELIEDLVILDIGLPDMDGFQVLREIRRFSQVPVIMLTVKSEDTDIAKGLELGADDYVTKPFSHIELIARVQAVMRRAG
jgi:two-component system KDP operon response regulator KdpE